MKLPKIWKLIDKTDRKKLHEGRNYGFGGGFAKRENDTLTMVMPISACGDYYAEIIHSEHTGKSWTAHGLHYSKQDIFDKKNGVAYMICNILPINHGGKYNEYDRDLKALEENYKNLQTFLNWFEKKFKSKIFTEIIKLEDNKFLFIVPLFWCQGTYLISLYKYLSRVGIFYKNEEPLSYLDSFNYNSGDQYMWNNIKPKLQRMLDGFIPEQKMTSNDSCPHNLGIVSYNFETAKVLYPNKVNTNVAGITMVKIT